MRIALIHDTDRRKGGAETYLHDLARGFADRGHRVDLFVREVGRGESPAGVTKVHRIGGSWAPRIIRPLVIGGALRGCFDPKEFDFSISLLRAAGAQMMVCGGTHRGLLEAINQSPGLRDRAEIYAELQAYRAAGIVIAHSHQLKQEIVKHYGIASDKVRVIHPPLHQHASVGKPASRLELKSKVGLKENRCTLLFASMGHKRKGLAILLEAMKGLPADQFELAVAGVPLDGWRVPANVKYLGVVSDMAAVYQAVDLTVLPSVYEPFGLVLIESIRAGTPVVTHRGVGACDVITEREGVVFDTLDADSLRAAILQAQNIKFDIRSDFCAVHRLTVEDHIAELIRIHEEVTPKAGINPLKTADKNASASIQSGAIPR